MFKRPGIGSLMAAGVLVAASALAACGSSGSSASASKSLVVWAISSQGPGYQAALNHDVKVFEAQHHVKVTVDWKSFNDLYTAVKLALSGPGSPDIVQLPQGWPMVELVKAHLLVNLNSYEKKYDWGSRFSKAELADASATANGKFFGTGNLYGVSDTVAFLGWYYNKQKLAGLGLQVPTTFSQFEHDLAVAKQHGQVPVQFGDSDQWPALHTFYTVLPQFVSQAKISNFTLGASGAQPINSSGAVQAASSLASWAKQGYLEPGFLGVSSDQAIAAFLKGQGVFFAPGGSWFSSEVIAAHEQNSIGFFLLPGQSAGGAPVTTGSGNNPFGVSTKTSNAPLAAEFLNAITDQQAEQEVVTVGAQIPAELYPFKYPTSGVFGSILSAYQKIKANGQVPWLDWASNSMYTQLSQNFQSLLGGKMSASAVLSAAQANQASYIQSLGR
jgi:raffinose/stachyose/melibiose transport system substrate-binding protein